MKNGQKDYFGHRIDGLARRETVRGPRRARRERCRSCATQDGDRWPEAFGDGPKFVCGVDVLAERAAREGCLVYSVGSNNDIRFEKAVYDYMKGCEVHTFDPSMGDTPFVGSEYATFHPVWKSTSASGAPDDSSLSHFSAKILISAQVPPVGPRLGRGGRKARRCTRVEMTGNG